MPHHPQNPRSPAPAHTLLRRSLPFLALALLLALARLPGERAQASQTQTGLAPTILFDVQHDTSPPLLEMSPTHAPARAPDIFSTPPDLPSFKNLEGLQADPVWQDTHSPVQMPAPLISFEGLGNLDNRAVINDGVLPPDANGAVGADHYIQMVNLVFAIWEKDGTLVYGPAANNTLWAGFGGLCETKNSGDPIVMYDHLSGRWFMSQFALHFGHEFHQCIAVSATSDPLGAWHRYDFFLSDTQLNDYPKFGVWPDGYYMTVNFFEGGRFAGAGAGVLEREKMLNGEAARLALFELAEVTPLHASLLPAGLDGPPPPAGTPGYFAELSEDVYNNDQLNLWALHIDWDTPENATFGLDGAPNWSLPTANLDSNMCDYARPCIPLPEVGPMSYVDAISDRLMFRLAYRHFDTHAALVVNHTVDVTRQDHAGVRWYELRNPGPGWHIHQQGTFAPDADHRWMGSAAMDASGNLAVGYSVASENTYPSIRYAGRLAGDPLGQLTQGETELIAGGGSQLISIFNRWGDYSALTLDPIDDCTFWYTQEYYAASSKSDWQTRIGSFKFPSCTSGETGNLGGLVTDAQTGHPLVGALVTRAGAQTLTNASGSYRFLNIPPGTAPLTATIYGYTPTVRIASVTAAQTTAQNLALQPRPTTPLTLTLTDGGGQGWPVYTAVQVAAPGYNETFFNDPLTGELQFNGIPGLTYTFSLASVIPGYAAAAYTLTAALSPTVAITLPIAAPCRAPSYFIQDQGLAYSEDFETDNGGYTTVLTTTWAWGAPTSGPAAAHSSANVWATNLQDNYADEETGYLLSPPIDLSAHVGHYFTLTWWQWLHSEPDYDFAGLEISKDGGQTWAHIFSRASGLVNATWTQYTVFLDSSYAVPDLQLRAYLHADVYLNYPGYYLDDISIRAHTCEFALGGLVIGRVFDSASGLGIDSAQITNSGAPQTHTVSIPALPGSGFYALFTEDLSPQTFTATKTGFFPDKRPAAPIAGRAVWLDFALDSNRYYWPLILK